MRIIKTKLDPIFLDYNYVSPFFLDPISHKMPPTTITKNTTTTMGDVFVDFVGTGGSNKENNAEDGIGSYVDVDPDKRKGIRKWKEGERQ